MVKKYFWTVFILLGIFTQGCLGPKTPMDPNPYDLTITPTPTDTVQTGSLTPTPTASTSATRTFTPTPTGSTTPTATFTSTSCHTMTATFTRTGSPTNTPTPNNTVTGSPTFTLTPIPPITLTPTFTPTGTVTGSVTPCPPSLVGASAGISAMNYGQVRGYVIRSQANWDTYRGFTGTTAPCDFSTQMVVVINWGTESCTPGGGLVVNYQINSACVSSGSVDVTAVKGSTCTCGGSCVFNMVSNQVQAVIVPLSGLPVSISGVTDVVQN